MRFRRYNRRLRPEEAIQIQVTDYMKLKLDFCLNMWYNIIVVKFNGLGVAGFSVYKQTL